MYDTLNTCYLWTRGCALPTGNKHIMELVSDLIAEN